MKKLRHDVNPFDLTKANDFSDHQILEYWVDLAGDAGLLSFLNPRSKVSHFILGSKGSGKTHLLRYCSAPVQRLRRDMPFIAAVEKDGYVGIYVRADGLNADRFRAKGQSEEVWDVVFKYHFENWLAQSLVRTALELLESLPVEPAVEERVVQDVLSLFDEPPLLAHRSLRALLEFLALTQRHLDRDINNSALSRTLHVQFLYSPTRLIFGIPTALARHVDELRNVLFLYLIDEIENFSSAQQEFLNSLIRYRTGPCSFRVGARLYGVKTLRTSGDGEPIKEGSEYESLRLDALMRDHKRGYGSFARQLCLKRIEDSGTRSLSSIQTPEDWLDRQFSAPASEHFYREETLRLVKKYEKAERPYFRRLREQLNTAYATGDTSALDYGAIEKTITCLQVPEYPLLEKLNIFLLYRDWSSNHRLDRSAERIRSECTSVLSASADAADYLQTYSHFKSDLLAQLYRDCNYKPVYAGLPTFIHMSQGVPRNLLGLLKQIYKRAAFYGEQPFTHAPISIDAQQDGVRDGAKWFLDDAQPDEFGREVRASVELLAELFREIRFSDKPAECAVVTFSVRESDLTDAAREILRHAENWSFLIEIPDGEKYKNSKAVIRKYQLNSILAPHWDLSPSRRGTIPLQANLANAIFDPSARSEFRQLMRDRVAGMMAPWFGRKRAATETTGLLDF